MYLSSSFINSTYCQILWSPSFTPPGTASNYDILVTSNGTTSNHFISESYYVLQWSDFSSCNDINVAL